MPRFLLTCLCIALLTGEANAFGGRFRGGSCGPGGCSPAVQQAQPVHNVAPQASQEAERGTNATAHTHGFQGHTDLHNRDAQGVANLQAHYGRVGHFGGNRGFEGCGMASTPQHAYAICCYGNDPSLVTVDVGYARGANGSYFCCRRYARRSN